jgi:hypothetical protein
VTWKAKANSVDIFSEPSRCILFFLLLSVELKCRHQLGETPTLGDYLAFFPEDADLIQRILAEAVPGRQDMNATLTGSTEPGACAANKVAGNANSENGPAPTNSLQTSTGMYLRGAITAFTAMAKLLQQSI